MSTLLKQLVKVRWRLLVLVSSTALLELALAPQTQAFPISVNTFRDDQPFQGSSGVHSLTSADGLLTVAAWADANATVPANLNQIGWLLGVDSGQGDGTLLDGHESITLQFDRGAGASHIAFVNTGGTGGTSNLNFVRINISGFSSDPAAYATTSMAQWIFNLNYTNGTLTFDYLWDTGNDYGQLLLANPAASAGRTLKITGGLSPAGNATSWVAALFRVDCQELYGAPVVQPLNIRDNFTNSYTMPDGKLTVKGYADRNLVAPANFGTYVDQSFGVYGGANSGAIDTNETLAVQFAPGFGLSRLDAVNSTGNITVSGFLSDPGFTDLATGSYNVSYANGTLNFTPIDGGHYIYSFTNRAASAGQTLRINVSPGMGNQFGVAGIGYVDAHTVIGPDVANYLSTYTSPDGLLTLNAFSDIAGTTPAYFYGNADWLGIYGGNNNQGVDGTESVQLQFSRTVGLSKIGTRYNSGTVVISGFSGNPGFADPSGTATGVSYAAGSLSYTFNAPFSPEHVVVFNNLGASMGQTLMLHTDGNPSSQFSLTRINYATAPATLNIAKYGDSIVLTWSFGTLEQSSTVNGAYDTVVGATSPYTNTPATAPKFFRLKIQ